MSMTVAVIAPGAMGAAIGRRLARHGAEVLTSSSGRSDASRARADAAGMRGTDDAEIVARCAFILSIVPPAAAAAIAGRFAPLLAGRNAPVFVDCNAISVAAMHEIGEIMRKAGAVCVDGSIIGAPPQDEGAGPALYVSGAAAGRVASLRENGIDVRVMEAPIGAATSLKLSYAGITKGLTAIAAAMILAAERNGAGAALKAELAASQAPLLARFGKTLPDMYPKSYRWVEEMRAIRDFVGEDFPESAIYEGAAGLFDRLASAADGPAARASLDEFLARPPV